MTKKLNEETLAEEPVIDWLKNENQKLSFFSDLLFPKLMSGETRV